MWVDREGFEGEKYDFMPVRYYLLHDINLTSTLLTTSCYSHAVFFSGGKDLREDALIILGLYHVLGLALPMEHFANLLGYKNLTSKVFRKVPTNLRNEGLLIYSFAGTGRGRTKTATFTPNGWQVARDLGVPGQHPSTNIETQDWIRRILTTKNEATMLNLLLEAQSDPQGIPNSTLCSMMGYSSTDSKGFREPLSSLQKVGIIRQEGKGKGGTKCVVLTDACFPHGRSPSRI